ncbi:MAG TPA: ATP-binding protein [Bacteriovoracaceae bacterium]|nr:ATP-binding protein [Bacteriovoracaceae bacterium]
MYPRTITAQITEALKQYQVVTLLGPRQSGKTTLAKTLGATFRYVNLEDMGQREIISQDPKGFFSSINSDVIIDEVQRLPEILSYLQVFTDQENYLHRFVLTGSNSLELSGQVSQSLAGRTRIFNILPLTYNELPIEIRPQTVDEALFKGLYPRIYHRELGPSGWLSDYIQTYIQKDVRQILNIENLHLFEKFLRLLAGRAGQLINFSALAGDVGTTMPTIKKWISVLEASYVVHTLVPHHNNFNKRMTKAPKVYFWDTGILVNLLRISDPSQLFTHPLRGQIFENWVINEKIKHCFNKGLRSPFYFWRDQHGHEIDVIEDRSDNLYPSEVKSSSTFHPDFVSGMEWFNKLQGKEGGEVIYGGEESFTFKGYKVTSWKNV